MARRDRPGDLAAVRHHPLDLLMPKKPGIEVLAGEVDESTARIPC